MSANNLTAIGNSNGDAVVNINVLILFCRRSIYTAAVHPDSCTELLNMMTVSEEQRDVELRPHSDYLLDGLCSKSDSLREQVSVISLSSEHTRQVLQTALQATLTSARLSPWIVLQGPARCGKTALLGDVPRLLHWQSIGAPVHIEYLNGRELSITPLRGALKAIRRAFMIALEHSPSVIVVDDIDRLCPCTVSATKSDAVEPIHPNEIVRSSVVALHLSRLMTLITQQQQEGETAMDRIMMLPELISHPDIQKRLATYAVYSRSVCVLSSMSGELQALHPSLFGPLGSTVLPRVVRIKEMKRSERVELLMKQMMAYASRSDDAAHVRDWIISASVSQLESLSLATEGLESRDINLFAEKIVQDAAIGYVLTPMLTQTFGLGTIMEARKALFFDAHSHARTSAHRHHTLSLAEISGLAECRDELLRLFRRPLIFRSLMSRSPIRLPRAALLYGPPGCGKTFAAQALINSLSGGDDPHSSSAVRSFVVRGPELLDKYIGSSEKAVRKLFQDARTGNSNQRHRMSVIFFDEFEALATKRGKDSTGVTDRVVNQMLTFIDGVEDCMGRIQKNSNAKSDDHGDDSEDDYGEDVQVLILAATSRPDLVDPALLRPGRIEKHIFVGLPSVEDIKLILKNLLSPYRNSDVSEVTELDDAIAVVAQRAAAAHYSAADVQGVVDSAYLVCVQQTIVNAAVSAKDGSAPTAMDSVFISGTALIRSFESSSPSLSRDDIHFYNTIYDRFSGRGIIDIRKTVDSKSCQA